MSITDVILRLKKLRSNSQLYNIEFKLTFELAPGPSCPVTKFGKENLRTLKYIVLHAIEITCF